MIKGEEIQTGEKIRLYAPAMTWSDRLNERMQELGWTKAELARRAGIPYDSVNKYLRGTIGQPRGDALERLARATQTNPLWLKEGVDSPSAPTTENDNSTVAGPLALPPGQVQFGGYVGAGGFLPADDVMDQRLEGEEVPSSVVPNPEYPELPQFAWLVRGDSMSEAGIHEGHWVVAARYLDYRDRIGELYNGLVVIVQRSRHSGSEIERTIKEVEFAQSGMYLVPRSKNPVHKQFFVPMDNEADNDVEEISVLAVVLSSFKVFSRRAR